MNGPGFIHLHVHSAYSLLEGALPLAKLLELAKADKQPAIGIADTNNLFGALEFSEKAAGKGIQPLLGCELALDWSNGDRSHERQGDRNRFGKGGVDEKQLRQIAESWGTMPADKRAQVVKEITRDLPAKFEPMIKNYFEALDKMHGYKK